MMIDDDQVVRFYHKTFENGGQQGSEVENRHDDWRNHLPCPCQAATKLACFQNHRERRIRPPSVSLAQRAELFQQERWSICSPSISLFVVCFLPISCLQEIRIHPSLLTLH